MSELKANVIVDVRVYDTNGNVLLEELDQEMCGEMTIDIEPHWFSPRICCVVVTPKEVIVDHE